MYLCKKSKDNEGANMKAGCALLTYLRSLEALYSKNRFSRLYTTDILGVLQVETTI